MLAPKRVKYRKPHRGHRRGVASRGNTLMYGNFGLQALECGWVTARQIEAARRCISRYSKRGGKLLIRVFPDHAVTKKPMEVRMGSGKGSPEYWVSVVLPQKILFEMSGVPDLVAKKALLNAGFKLPVKTQILTKTV